MYVQLFLQLFSSSCWTEFRSVWYLSGRRPSSCSTPLPRHMPIPRRCFSLEPGSTPFSTGHGLTADNTTRYQGGGQGISL
ncbi:hypothetical protein BKA82DRAFT_4110936, partial [Pisolithus tinctorius]